MYRNARPTAMRMLIQGRPPVTDPEALASAARHDTECAQKGWTMPMLPTIREARSQATAVLHSQGWVFDGAYWVSEDGSSGYALTYTLAVTEDGGERVTSVALQGPSSVVNGDLIRMAPIQLLRFNR